MVFKYGDEVLLIDNKKRRHLITLEEGSAWHSHAGFLSHEEIVGKPDGCVLETTQRQKLTALRPTLADFVLEMPRGAQVIYPKDLGPILMHADLFPGAKVLESGVGSGALTMAALRAIGPEGSLVGYELREDFANRAVKNINTFLGSEVPLRVEIRDIYDGIGERELDRILLDLPEPWRVVKHATDALSPGGILLSYLPTIGQVAELRAVLEDSPFGLETTVEVLQRGWHIEAKSVRPDHRMVAHTGFLTTARLLS